MTDDAPQRSKPRPSYMLPQRMVELRNRLGWTQDELAQHMGVDRRTVINWERGRSCIHAAVARLLQAYADGTLAAALPKPACFIT